MENEDWDGHPQSYDVIMFLTGKKLSDVMGKWALLASFSSDIVLQS
jgi:hypothetical protein